MSEQDSVNQVKELHKEAILAKPNVVGVGTGCKARGGQTTDELCIVAMVRRKVPSARLPPDARIPPVIDGVPTDIMRVGDLWALQARNERWRPAPGGVSIGHYQVTAGTFGCVVHDRATGARLILSNNHVLANSNEAEIGDPIVQPGPADGGRVPDDTIAHLERFCMIEFGTSAPACPVALGVANAANALAGLVGSKHRLQALRIQPSAANVVDAAVARPVDGGDILGEILGIGAVEGTRPASLLMTVRKSGSTTQLSSGVVVVLNATVLVNYAPGRITRFDDQIVTSAMCQGGDSGSLLVAGDSLDAVGLLFAGSDQVTVYNPIQQVLESLEVSMGAAETSRPDMRAALAKARAVKRAYEGELLSKANVVGVGTGMRQKDGKPTGEVALVVMVKEKVPPDQLAAEDAIPTQIEGARVDVQEVGELKAQ
jgi:hypothetical protein